MGPPRRWRRFIARISACDRSPAVGFRASPVPHSRLPLPLRAFQSAVPFATYLKLFSIRQITMPRSSTRRPVGSMPKKVPRYAFELVFTTLVEPDARPDDEVLDGG